MGVQPHPHRRLRGAHRGPRFRLSTLVRGHFRHPVPSPVASAQRDCATNLRRNLGVSGPAGGACGHVGGVSGIGGHVERRGRAGLPERGVRRDRGDIGSPPGAVGSPAVAGGVCRGGAGVLRAVAVAGVGGSRTGVGAVS